MSIDWLASVLTIVGALLLAVNCRYSRAGWVCFLLANLLWVQHGVSVSTYSLVVQQAVLTGTSLLGFFRWTPPSA